VGATNEAHLVVEETVFEPLAAAYAAFRPEDRREGCVVVDIGAHSTGVAAYYGESLLFSSTLPVCGDHFTRDVARGLSLSYDDATAIKEQHGCALAGLTADNSLIELPSGPGRPAREASRRELNIILEARAFELFEFVRRELAHIGMEQESIACALTGGGARLPGMCDVAEKALRCQASIGLPAGILDWPPQIDDPAWTTAAGLAMYSARLKLRAELDRNHRGFFAKVMGM
jgi:cell division protein FtsA